MIIAAGRRIPIPGVGGRAGPLSGPHPGAQNPILYSLRLMPRPKVLLVVGARPEVIKTAPAFGNVLDELTSLASVTSYLS